MNGPDAAAGSTFNFLKTIGTIVPNKLDKVIAAISAIDAVPLTLKQS